MKNKQNGFAGIAIIILIAIAAVGGGAYVYNKQNVKVSDNVNTNTGIEEVSVPVADNKKDADVNVNTEVKVANLTDTQVVAALNAELVATDRSKFQYKPQANGVFGVSLGTAFNKVENIYKGDLNNDGYADALILVSSCSKTNDCGYGLKAVVSKKDGSVESVNNLETPDSISGWSGGNHTVFDEVKIDNGIVYITSSSFYSSGDVKTADKLPKQTKKFQLKGNALVEIK